MKSTHSRDRNLFFNYDRGDLIGPQKKGNNLSFDIGATKQDFNKVRRPIGRDQNTFFRVRKTVQPTLRTRIIKAIDPISRIVGQLPTTKKERQAEAVVSSIESILRSLKSFISSPELDAQGNIVLDPVTNQPVIRARTITEILDVSHAALNQVYAQNNVVLNPTFQLIVNSFTAKSSINVMTNVRDIIKLKPDMTQNEKDLVFKNEILVERVDKDDEIKDNSEVAKAIPKAMLEQKTNDGDWRGSYPDKWIRPEQWRTILQDKRLKLALFDVINARESALSRFGTRLRGVGGTVLEHPLSLKMGQQFGRNNNASLNLETLRFRRQGDIPEDERAAP